jgi:hypothetical protein
MHTLCDTVPQLSAQRGSGNPDRIMVARMAAFDLVAEKAEPKVIKD